MKNLTIVFLALLPSFLIAQTPLRFEGVVESKGDAEVLYKRAFRFLNDYENANGMIGVEHAEKVSYAVEIPYHQKKEIWGGSELSHGVVKFEIDLYFKDGRYKYVMSNFRHVADNGHSFDVLTDEVECPRSFKMTAKFWRNNVWKDLKERSTAFAKLIAQDIEDYMKAPPVIDKDEMEGW